MVREEASRTAKAFSIVSYQLRRRQSTSIGGSKTIWLRRREHGYVTLAAARAILAKGRFAYAELQRLLDGEWRVVQEAGDAAWKAEYERARSQNE